MKTLGRLIIYLKPHWPQVLFAYLCLTTTTLLGLAIPWLIKEVIDRGLANGDRTFIVFASLAVIAITSVKAIFSFGQSYLNEYLASSVTVDLRNELYGHLQHLDFTFHDRSQTGELMSRMTSDVDSVRQLTSNGMVTGLNALLTILGVSGLMLTMDWRLATVTLLLLPILTATAIAVSRRLRPLYRSIQEQFAVMSSVLQENLSGAHVVRSFARENFETSKFANENSELMKRNIKAQNQAAFNLPFMAFLVSLATAAIIWYGGHEVIGGTMSVGTLVAFNGYLAMLLMPVRRIGFLTNLIARSISSGDRIFEILDARPEVQERPDAKVLDSIDGLVRFETVSFKYGGPGSSPILRDINLEAKPGQVVALLGATGSGKSTVIGLIPRFYDVTSGRITIDGLDVRDFNLTSLRKHIGLVLQDTFLFSGSVRRNISYGRPDASMDEIVAAATAARAHDFIMKFPRGYNTRVGERGITLSGGQRQRITIARALLLNPKILILDDSTSSVDTETEFLLQQALQELMKGRTTFVIAHRLTTIKNADQIIVLESGGIVETGTHSELLANNGAYRHIYDLQLREQEESAHKMLEAVPVPDEVKNG